MSAGPGEIRDASSTGSDARKLTAEAFRNEDGSMDYVSLGLTLIGSVVAAWSVGIAAVIDAVFQLVIGGIDWVASFSSGLVTEGAGVFITLGTRAWALGISPIRGLSGIWVPVVVLAVALGYLYLLQRGDR